MSYNTFTGFNLGEDQLYPNTSFYVFQEKSAKKKRKIETGNPLSASPSFWPTGGNHIKNKVPILLLRTVGEN